MADRPVQTKALPFGLLEYDGDGTIEGFAAVMGNVDSDNERIVNGAFAKSIAERKHKIVLGLDHSIGLGVTTELEEVGRNDLPASILKAAPDATGGLWAKGQVMETAENITHLQRIRDAADRGDGPLMSVTIKALQTRDARTKHGKAVTDLIECKLIEWGPQLRLKAINQAARVTRVKASDGSDIDAPMDDAAVSFNDGTPAEWSYATGISEDGSLGVVYPLTLKAVAGSFEDRRDTVSAALQKANVFRIANDDSSYFDIAGTYADAVVVYVRANGKTTHYRVPYSILDNDVTLGDAVEVKLSTVVTAKAGDTDECEDESMDEAFCLSIVRDVLTSEKAGRVLNGKNLAMLKDAIAALERIHAAAMGTDEEAATPTDDAKSKAADSTEGEAARTLRSDVLRGLEVDLSMLSTRAKMLATVG